MSLNRVILATAAALVVGCVTINIYFPEAAAQEAADRIIDEVRGVPDATAPADAVPDAAGPDTSTVVAPAGAVLVAAAARVLDWLVPAAAAQQADFDVQSPASRALEAALKARFPRLEPHLDSGAIGLGAGGLLEIRDRNAVPLAARNTLRQLVTEQNADWEALYAEIARINGHPEWVDQIRKVFAERWVAKAESGWYYRDSAGNWQRK